MSYEPQCTGEVRCTRCRKKKPALAFAPHPKKLNGLNSWCRDCQQEVSEAARSRNKSEKKKISHGLYDFD